MFEDIINIPGFWTVHGPKDDVVLSTRIRLARNMRALSFPGRLDEGELETLYHALEKFAAESLYAKKVTIVDLGRADISEKRLLRERNIITSEMEASVNSQVALDSEEDFTILLNDEDHFRIQVIRSGLQLMEAYRTADKVDDELNQFVAYAYRDDLGYLTACPSNLGTGLKASFMLHLPALTLRNRVGDFVSEVKKSKAEVKGTVGDNKKAIGSIYQVSSKVALGLSEVDIIEGMDELANRIIAMEDKERDEYVSGDRLDLEDRVWKAFGFLRFARKISYVEAMENLSELRLGIILAVVRNLELGLVNDLMVNIQWSHLQRNSGRMLKSTAEADEYRALYIRERLSDMGKEDV